MFVVNDDVTRHMIQCQSGNTRNEYSDARKTDKSPLFTIGNPKYTFEEINILEMASL